MRFDKVWRDLYDTGMHLTARAHSGLYALILLLLPTASLWSATFRVATYNLENYVDTPNRNRPTKSPESKSKIREHIRALTPDVLAVQEIGSTNTLQELREALKNEGLDFPYWEHVSGFDTNINIAILSRFPLSARRPHTKESFLLNGRRFRVSRGFSEVDIQVNAHYGFTLITAHLKSKREIAEADETELRLEEAKLLRVKIEARLNADPKANLIVLGDLNDTKDSPSTRAVLGRGKFKLLDTRPAERNGDDAPGPNSAWQPRNVTWTHYYGKEDSYQRIDYILVSPGMAAEWIPDETYVLAVPNWGMASDHRPLVATFEATDQ